MKVLKQPKFRNQTDCYSGKRRLNLNPHIAEEEIKLVLTILSLFLKGFFILDLTYILFLEVLLLDWYPYVSLCILFSISLLSPQFLMVYINTSEISLFSSVTIVCNNFN